MTDDRTLQDTLRDHANDITVEMSAVVAALMRRAADYIDTLQTAEFGDPSEFLILPWGGVMRKSEVKWVKKGEYQDAWAVSIGIADTQIVWPLQGTLESQCDKWVADLEKQFGVTCRSQNTEENTAGDGGGEDSQND